MEEYIINLRKKIGHDKVILNYAGCVFFTDGGKIVLQKRSDCNEWGFFGGLVELGESLEEAAVREVKEESGYDVEITSLYGIYSKYFATYSNGDEAQTVCTLFKAKIVGGEPIASNSETNEIGYFDLSNPPKMFCKQHQDILDDIISGKEYVYK